MASYLEKQIFNSYFSQDAQNIRTMTEIAKENNVSVEKVSNTINWILPDLRKYFDEFLKEEKAFADEEDSVYAMEDRVIKKLASATELNEDAIRRAFHRKNPSTGNDKNDLSNDENTIMISSDVNIIIPANLSGFADEIAEYCRAKNYNIEVTNSQIPGGKIIINARNKHAFGPIDMESVKDYL